ncbi:MAG: NAD(+) diphosphatase [Dermatophilaceae bacterium]
MPPGSPMYPPSPSIVPTPAAVPPRAPGSPTPLDSSSLPGLALSAAALDRRAELRGDPALVTRLLADPATAVLRLRGDRAEVRDTASGPRVVFTAPRPDDARHLVCYLGDAGGRAHLGLVDGAPPPEADDGSWRSLRRVGADLPDLDAAAFATTLALANWHRTHGFCSRCGSATEPDLAGWIRRCRSDGSDHYPRTDMAVIVAVVDDADRLLLARGRGFRAGGMSVLAGFVEPGETVAAAVAREVGEEVGVTVTDITYLGDQPWPFPSSLMLGFTARARSTDLRMTDGEIEEARWFSREGLTAALANGSVLVSGRLSISRRLIEHWFGGPLGVPDVVLHPA